MVAIKTLILVSCLEMFQVESSRVPGDIDMGYPPPPPNCVTFVGFPPPPGSTLADSRSFLPLNKPLKEEETKTNLHSPDSKQYTILQPAGT